MPNNTDDHARQTNIPAVGETDLDEQGSIGGDEGESGSLYQDDLDTSDSKTVLVTEEANEYPADLLQIPEHELKDELDKYDDDVMDTDNDDERESLEDRDENDANAASTS